MENPCYSDIDSETFTKLSTYKDVFFSFVTLNFFLNQYINYRNAVPSYLILSTRCAVV